MSSLREYCYRCEQLRKNRPLQYQGTGPVFSCSRKKPTPEPDFFTQQMMKSTSQLRREAEEEAEDREGLVRSQAKRYKEGTSSDIKRLKDFLKKNNIKGVAVNSIIEDYITGHVAEERYSDVGTPYHGARYGSTFFNRPEGIDAFFKKYGNPSKFKDLKRDFRPYKSSKEEIEEEERLDKIRVPHSVRYPRSTYDLSGPSDAEIERQNEERKRQQEAELERYMDDDDY